jgi:plastocyanin
VNYGRTPAQARLGRAGAFVSLALAAAFAAGACDRADRGRDEGPRVLELTHDTIRLEAGVRLHDVAVRREAGGEFHPAHVQAAQGDVVRFTAGDGAGHAISFLGAELDPAVRHFLEESGQLRGPPLIASGASWVITTANAPPGEYPFHCTTHAVRGRLTVAARRQD